MRWKNNRIQITSFVNACDWVDLRRDLKWSWLSYLTFKATFLPMEYQCDADCRNRVRAK